MGKHSPRITLTNMSINSLPDNLFTHFERGISFLDLSDNPLNNVDSKSFLGLSRIYSLRLENVNVIITPDFFQHMQTVKALYISGPTLKLTRNIWDEIELTSLSLENVGLSDISSHIWTGSESSLVYLSLNGNHFQTIYSLVFKDLTRLETLRLEKCDIEHINPWAFRGPIHLFVLSLHGNNFPTLTAHSFTGISLTLRDLDLGNCGIQYINSEAFEGLGEYYSLAIYLQDNPLIQIDANMFGITGFEKQALLFGCDFIPCVQDLCWINEKSAVVRSNCEREPMCDNFEKSVSNYLEDEC